MTLVYEPKGRAREYSPLACNVYRGCDHRCEYCYAPSATRRKKEAFGEPTMRPGGFVDKLRKELQKHSGHGERVLLSFTCDPYQTLDVEHAITRQTIQLLHRYGYNVQILTKGGTRALRDIDLFTRDDAFASTLTFITVNQSLEWEPGAALPDDRIEAIKQFHAKGIPTWVSLEPVLCPTSALYIIKRTHAFVDLYKIGKLNYHPLAKDIDWSTFGLDAIQLLESLDQPYYIKDDLVKLLPADSLGPHHITVKDLESQQRPVMRHLL